MNIVQNCTEHNLASPVLLFIRTSPACLNPLIGRSSTYDFCYTILVQEPAMCTSGVCVSGGMSPIAKPCNIGSSNKFSTHHRVFPRPVLTCVRNVGTCVRKLSGRRPLPRPKGEPARGSGGMLPRKFLKFDVAKTAIFMYFYAFSSAFFLSTVP